jgi:hypothetical protein
MPHLEKEIVTYDSMRERLESEHMGEWVLIHDTELVGLYKTFEIVAQEAVKRFGAGPAAKRQRTCPKRVF